MSGGAGRPRGAGAGPAGVGADTRAGAVDAARLERTVRDLVRIDSVNPSLVEGAAGESAIADRVAAALRDAGLEVTVLEATPGRPSVVGRLPGGGDGPSLMLNAHVDTVGVEGMDEPFSGRVADGRLHGRGAYDMKGALAACLEAARALAERSRAAGAPPAGDLLVAAVADEEHASLGMEEVLGHVRPDAAIVTEPTALAACVAHRGFEWLEVVVHGRAAHGSRWDEGVDANLRMGRFLSRLEALSRELLARPGHALLGPPSLHAALLEGGSGISTYAARSACRVERRTVPGEAEGTPEEELTGILEALAREDPSFRHELRTTFSRRPFETDAGSPIVRCLREAASRRLGSEPELVGESPWTDAALLADAGADTVVFGPAGAGAHAAEEWVDLGSCVRLAEVLVETADDWLGGPREAPARRPEADGP